MVLDNDLENNLMDTLNDKTVEKKNNYYTNYYCFVVTYILFICYIITFVVSFTILIITMLSGKNIPPKYQFFVTMFRVDIVILIGILLVFSIRYCVYKCLRQYLYSH